MHELNKPPLPDQGPHIITIDGPAGAGKSTTARMLAERLGWEHLDTGATYRAMAAVALMNGIKPEDREMLIEMSERVAISFEGPISDRKVIADGVDITTIIRSPDVSRASSPISAVPEVRERLVALQRNLAEGRNTVAEGRDTGTVVFPNATAKIFLTASPEVRAARRVMDFAGQKLIVSVEDVLKDIQTRDERDSTREVSPLKPAEDAFIVTTDNLEPSEVVDRIIAYYVEITS